MKKIIFIISFMILGILLQFLAHAAIEAWYIELLVNDFETYGLSFSWGQWYMIHNVGAVLFLVAGIVFGLSQGKYWWHLLYEQKDSEISPSIS